MARSHPSRVPPWPKTQIIIGSPRRTMPLARSNQCTVKLDIVLLIHKLNKLSRHSNHLSNNNNLLSAQVQHQRMAVNKIVVVNNRYRICRLLWWSRFKTWSRMVRSTLERMSNVSRWSQHWESSCLIWPTSLVKCLSHTIAMPYLIKWFKTC